MKYFNTLIILVLVTTCFTLKHDLQAQNKETHPSPTDNIKPAPEMTGPFQTPELVVPIDTVTELNADMARAAEFHTNLMWAVYCGTGEKNIRKSKTIYDTLIKAYGQNDATSTISDGVVSSADLSLVYTERAKLRYNTFTTHLQDIKGAEEDVRKAIALNPDNIQATWLLAQILTRKFFATPENRNDARVRTLQEEMFAVLEQVTKLDPDHHRAHYYLGTMARDIGQIELAIISFKALTRIRPYDDQFHRELGELYEMQNHLEEALHAYERVVTILPQDLSARNRLGDLYLKTGNYPAATETFLVTLTQLEMQAGNETRNGRLRNRNPARAAQEANAAEIEAHYGISLAYQAQNDFEKSEFHLTRYITLLEATSGFNAGRNSTC